MKKINYKFISAIIVIALILFGVGYVFNSESTKKSSLAIRNKTNSVHFDSDPDIGVWDLSTSWVNKNGNSNVTIDGDLVTID